MLVSGGLLFIPRNRNFIFAQGGSTIWGVYYLGGSTIRGGGGVYLKSNYFKYFNYFKSGHHSPAQILWSGKISFGLVTPDFFRARWPRVSLQIFFAAAPAQLSLQIFH